MSTQLVLLLFIVGLVILSIELFLPNMKEKFVLLFFIIFLLAVTSRIGNYYPYSDLGSYISRFGNNDNAYFGPGYQFFTKIIKNIFGNSSKSLLISVSSYNFIIALLTVKVLECDGIIKYAKKEEKGRSNQYVGTFLFIYAMYWGLSFSSEVIRSGLAITTSMLAISLIITKKNKFAALIYLISIALHWTQIFLLPFLLIVKSKNNNFFLKRYVLVMWIFIIIFLDFINFSSLVIKIAIIPIGWFLEKFSLSHHYLVYLLPGERNGIFSYVDRQYVFYRLTGFVLLLGNIENKKYNIFIQGYFFGLTIFSVANSLPAVTRMQWIYLNLSIFALYYFVKEDIKYSKGIKFTVISLYMFAQSIMAVLYLRHLG